MRGMRPFLLAVALCCAALPAAAVYPEKPIKEIPKWAEVVKRSGAKID